jgi:hypothetical protein
MAVAVIGGLILSTMLTLLVIPAVYTIVDDITTAGKRRFRFWHVAGQDQLSEVAEAEREERLSGSYREELEGELEPMDS